MNVFYTCHDEIFDSAAKALRKSVSLFYPDIPFIEFNVPRSGSFNLRAFCDFHLQKGWELLNEYDRIISLDTDQIMCAPCPDFFGDFDLGVVQNNIPVDDRYGGSSYGVYINAGTTICTNKMAWKEWMDEYYRKCNERWEELNEQNALNWVYHNSKLNIKLLEFDDRSYGTYALSQYENIFLEGDDLWVPPINQLIPKKKVCLFHAAGNEWKIKETGNINFDHIKDEKARERIRSYGS